MKAHVPGAAAALAALLLLTAHAGARGFDTAPYRHVKDVQPGPAGDTPAPAAVVLDPETLAAAQPDLRDLRLVDDLGQARPWLARQRKETATVGAQRALRSRIDGFETGPDGGIRFSLHVDKPESAGNAEALILDLDIPQRNFERRIRVRGIGEGGAETVLAEDELLFDYSRHVDVRRTQVRLPADRYARYTVELDPTQQRVPDPTIEQTVERRGGLPFSEVERRVLRSEPIRIDRATLHAVVPERREGRPVLQRHTLPVVDVHEGAAGRETVWRVRTGRLPLVSLRIEPEAAPFSRRVRVEAIRTAGDRQGVPVGNGVIHRVETGVLRSSRLDLALQGDLRSADELRVTAWNEDNPPLGETRFSGEAEVWEVVFFPEPDRRYRLFYGSDRVSPPRYDTAALMAAVGPAATRTYELGEGGANPEYASGRRLFGTGRSVFVPALVLAAAGLLWLIAWGARRIPPADDGPASPGGEAA